MLRFSLQFSSEICPFSEEWMYFLLSERGFGKRLIRCVPNVYMVLRRIFGARWDDGTGEWGRLHKEELNDLYPSPNIVRVITCRRMWWAGHVARMDEERGSIGSWFGNRRERDHWGDLGLDGWIILGWISRRLDVGMWTGLGWPKLWTGSGGLWVR